ncbi:hypothetical protein BFJ66_g1055 [Fusarium oxysporum f. sp. cepae]|uniref:CSC1/OSCA1-like N-terminal transmembrane domain-containing protein n=1 Tax=Fusarium oxysporum f. sp. cepae TaxID=396571 RepID=A0A3L6NMI8_FUSOX|nr:hypothetical protein BFJ65_g9214 [Fusarium oxysporum f. sp. cepae]RKK62250.1 hypothetical protein BFJ66_g1055 [Fusarium oxysporum f. sp. cepae]
MSAPRSRQRLGLHQIVPSPDSVAGHTTIESIIAIHGLGTESPRTWEFKRSEGRVVNWLADEDMLPATVPEARIFTYDWNANYFQDAPVQTLLSHADTLLAHIAETRDVKSRPIIFIASCFGGLVLIEAINRAGQEGSPYRHVLLSTVGIVFLATPFNGADASREARWQVVVGGIMGEDTSDELIKDLERKHDLVHRRVQKFTEIANADAIRLHLYLGSASETLSASSTSSDRPTTTSSGFQGTPTSAADKDKGIGVVSFLTAVAVAVAVFAVQILLFLILRNKLACIFKPKTYLVPERERTESPPNKPLAMLKTLWHYGDREVIEKCGLDAYFFLRYLKTLLIIFLPIGAIVMPILILLNYVGGLG